MSQTFEDSFTAFQRAAVKLARMNDIISNAVSGMNMSTARFQAAAARIAQKPETDLAQNLVEAKLASLAFKASVAVVKTANEMWKATLDILA